MITLNQKKFIKSLAQKKYRAANNCFIVEGEKLVTELLQSDYKVHSIYALKEWIEKNSYTNAQEVTKKELASISLLKTPNKVLAIAKHKLNENKSTSSSLTLALDNVNDPGNMGTIIRTADWFGINTIVCSKECVDVYNPKVVQSTMGSLFHVDVYYQSLKEFFRTTDKIIYGATLKGENIYKQSLVSEGSILLMGNESNGISSDLLEFVDSEISIPKIGRAESLNVSIATAILCSEFLKERSNSQ